MTFELRAACAIDSLGIGQRLDVMRRVSEKREQRQNEVREFRRLLIDEFGECMICGASERKPHRGMPELSRLSVHEILNGPLRAKVLDEPCALLVVCWNCNSNELTNKSTWPVARQLAVLRSKAKHYYDLERFCFLRNQNAPNYITEDEVNEYCISV